MSQTLMVKFGADTGGAKRAIVELASTVAQNAVTMATAVRGQVQTVDELKDKLGRLGNIARGAVAGFVAFEVVRHSMAAVSKSIEAVNAEMERLVSLGAKAEGMGVGTTFLQSWQAQAKGLNEEAGTLEAMLTRARAASTVRQGTGDDGPGSDISRMLGQQAKAGNIGKGDVAAFAGEDTQEGRIRVVLDLIQRMMNEGKQLAALNIAGTMFGAGFEEKLRAGVDMVSRMKEALNGLTVGPDGRIIPPEEIAAANRLKETLDEASRIMAESMRPVNEDLARLSQQQAQSWAETKVQIAQLVSYLMEVYKWVSSIRDAFAQWGSNDFWKGVVKWADEKGLVDKSFSPPGIDNGFEKAGPEQPPMVARFKIAAPKGDTSRNLPKIGGGGGGGGTQTDPVDGFINQIERSTAALKAEIEAFSKSNAEKRVAMDLAKAEEIAKQNGTTLTEQQIARIKAASAAAGEYKDKLQDLEQAQRQAAEAARYFGNAAADALGDMVFNGAKATDVIKGLISSFGRTSLNALITGTGPLAGLFGTSAAASAGSDAVGGLTGLVRDAARGSGGGISGFLGSLFGGFRANGGPVQAGRVYRINELGQELFAPGTDGRIIPAGGRGGAAAGSSSATYAPTWNIDAPQAGPGVIETVRGMIAEHDRQINRSLPARFAQSRAKFGQF